MAKARHSSKLRQFLCDLRDDMGVQFNMCDLAQRCGVSSNTVRKWFSGYYPHWHVWWTIARYFEPYHYSKQRKIKIGIEELCQ